MKRNSILLLSTMLAIGMITQVQAPRRPVNKVTSWHDPERVEKAKHKRALRAAKRLKHSNT